MPSTSFRRFLWVLSGLEQRGDGDRSLPELSDMMVWSSLRAPDTGGVTSGPRVVSRNCHAPSRERALQGNRPTRDLPGSLSPACFSSPRNTPRHPSSLVDCLVIPLGVRIAVASRPRLFVPTPYSDLQLWCGADLPLLLYDILDSFLAGCEGVITVC